MKTEQSPGNSTLNTASRTRTGAQASRARPGAGAGPEPSWSLQQGLDQSVQAETSCGRCRAGEPHAGPPRPSSLLGFPLAGGTKRVRLESQVLQGGRRPCLVPVGPRAVRGLDRLLPQVAGK